MAGHQSFGHYKGMWFFVTFCISKAYHDSLFPMTTMNATLWYSLISNILSRWEDFFAKAESSIFYDVVVKNQSAEWKPNQICLRLNQFSKAMLFFAGKIHSFAEILIEYSWGKIYRAIKQISKRIFLTLHFVKKQNQNALFKSMATFFVDLCKL